MGLPIIQYIVQIVKNITELGNKIIDSADNEKYAKAVNSLNKNVDETYEKMRELIEKDETLTIEQKLDKLEKLANSQIAAKQSCDETLKGNREHVHKIVSEVFFGLTTCGISYIPKIIGSKKNIAQLENKETKYNE